MILKLFTYCNCTYMYKKLLIEFNYLPHDENTKDFNG